ncbi:MAG: beta-ketoacyl-[acyl-carrier-protein] synthase family protein [Lentisphaeria bacterium]|nr:beta-ketoacyl-[acyl-carrier-protein] synthase family protein [Lentisphaeria bacterium]
MKRVVITGMGVITPFGHGVDALMNGLASGHNAVRFMEGWDRYEGMRSLVAAPARLGDVSRIPRKQRRSMGRLSLFAVLAAEEALRASGLDIQTVGNDQVGCVMGSTMGGAEALTETFETMSVNPDLSLLKSMNFFKCVSHTAAMNVAQYFGLTGIVMATSAACASSLQAVGTGYDLIRLGRQKAVLCGGSEEAHPTVTASFDILFATSAGYNDHPELTPRPFDRDRDGLVCGEGAGVLVLEDFDHARQRGATILAEVTGYQTGGSGEHVSQSNQEAISRCVRGALAEAGVAPEAVDYISAHATGTVQGDLEEALAIREIFGDRVPVSSLKGHIGHTLGASGAIELAATLRMMRDGVIYPTLNLQNEDDKARGLKYIKQTEKRPVNTILKNCFAFGGINAAVVCQKVDAS